MNTYIILTENEKLQVEQKVAQNLVHHLYKSTLSGAFTGCLANLCIFVYLYFFTALVNPWLIPWVAGFNLTLVLLVILYIRYNHYMANNPEPNKTQLLRWKWLFFSFIVACSIFWGSLVGFIATNIIAQFLIITMLVMLASAYSMGTVGSSGLCAATLVCMLSPLCLWSIRHGSIHYIIGGIFVFIYYLYLLGMNSRSTKWLIDSLRLEIENSLFTHQANHDIITGLPNYRPLMLHIENCITNSKQNNSNFMVIYFAINDIEMFNSGMGYQVVDDIMKILAERFNALIAELDYKDKYFIAIPRSDTFAIVIDQFDVGDESMHIANITKVLNESLIINNKENKLTASLGVSFFPKDGVDAITLQRNSQAAMLEAKQSGGGHTKFYEQDLNLHIPRRLELSTALHYAINNNDFLVYYQPIITAATGKICGAEALVRWQHPMHGLIFPDEFIKLAEEIGLIHKIGEIVFAVACQQQKEWQAQFNTKMKIAVNVSVQQLHNSDFVNLVCDCVDKNLMDPNCIEFEITESEILDEQAIPSIKKLIDLGFSISIDDFGTGYAGMKFLQEFKIEKIKIDKSFISLLPGCSDDQKLVLSVLAMTKELGIKTLAEGVETKEQQDFLTTNGCDYLQGYYYSKPVPAKQFEELFKKFG